jgi:lipid A 3-O-deacylase
MMRQIKWLLAGLISFSFAGASLAADEVYVQMGAMVHPGGKNDPSEAEAGIGWNLPWQWKDGKLTTRLETGVGYEKARENDIVRVMVTPVLRYRFNGSGADGLFAEGGIGVTYLNQTGLSEKYTLGSHVLFQDRLGLGYAMGANELTLFVTHMSSGGTKEPNPGTEAVSLRYTRTF